MEPSKQKLREKYTKLPRDIKESLFSEASANSIGSIASKYGLPAEKNGILADESGLVLFGILHPKDFIPDLAQKLGIDREVARKIAEEVNQQIFQPVRESLRKLHGLDQEIKITENSPPQKIAPAPPPPTARPAAPPSPAKNRPDFQGGKPPAKIVITEDKSIPKETPKEELKPLEIRPIKGGPFGGESGAEEKKIPPAKTTPPQTPPFQGGEKGAVPPQQESNVFGNQPPPKKLSEIMKEPERIPPRPQLDYPPRRSEEPSQRLSGLRVMPKSPEEIHKGTKPPTPPPDLPFMNPADSSNPPKDGHPIPPKPGGDPYREKI